MNNPVFDLEALGRYYTGTSNALDSRGAPAVPHCENNGGLAENRLL